MLDCPTQTSLAAALRRTALPVATAAALTAGATAGLCAAFSPMVFVHASLLLATGLVGMPLLFALALGAAKVVLWSLLALLALPWWLRRRATGLGGVAAAMFLRWRTMLPGYWRALRRVDRPVLWGAVLGVPLGTALFVLANGVLGDGLRGP